MSNCPGRKSDFVLYRYDPSLAAAVIFLVLFKLSTILHAVQAVRTRSWYLTPFIIGGIFEALGYVGRIWSSKDPCITGPFIMQTLLLLLGPVLFAASIYMILGRIILLTGGEKHSIVRRTWLTKIFVGGDILSFLMQGAGGGILSSAKGDSKKQKNGERLIVGGLFVQLLFFGFFIVAAAIFQRRGREHLRSLPSTITWRKHLYVLYFTSTMILIRSVFRVIEYLQGNAGYLLRNEVFLYVFDSVLMLAVMVAMNIVHPGQIAIMLKEKANMRNNVELGQMDKEGNNDSEYSPPEDARRL